MSHSASETNRIISLLRHRLLGTQPEKEFDDIVDLAAHICSAPMGGVTLIDAERQWFKAKRGFEVRETAREIAFCNYAISNNELFIVPNACRDSRFANNPLVTNEPRICFYAGVPIKSVDGFNLGTLWVADKVPRTLTLEQQTYLGKLGSQVEALLRLKFYLEELHSALQSREDVLKKVRDLERIIRTSEVRRRKTHE